MKFNQYIAMILLSCCVIFTANGQPVKISFAGRATPAIIDLQNCLKGYPAGAITIKKVPLENRTGQDFYLSSASGNTEIRYTTENSLENAIYTYLDLLGFRWYGPGDNWFVKPGTFKQIAVAGKWTSPSFRNRIFFGTGGLEFGTIPPYDPGNQYKEKWLAWKRRNRFNADFAAAGHSGQAFYNANRSLLDAHPDWFANASGRVNGRLKIDQPGAVQAYKAWIGTIYNQSKTPFIALGVDPEDGRGAADDPLPKKMPGIKNHADKWWWLANEVAGDYPEDDPRVVVTAYAYGDGAYNALTPSFLLRKNVYPVIIPYAFQKAYPPDEMIRSWAAKVKGKMGIYDYWNITQWSVGMPQFNIYVIPERLRFWKANKIDGVYLETTDAAGPMGHALWLAGQLQWNIHQDFEKLYKQYLEDCFGAAAGTLKEMFNRWSRNYQDAAEVAFSLQDLKKATGHVSKGSSEWRRIAELKAYVHFMKMYYEHDGTQESKNRIFNYLYSIHHLMLVQTAAFVGQSYITPLDKGNVVPSGNGVRPIGYETIEQQFLQDLKGAPRSYQLSEFQFNFDKTRYIAPIPKDVWLFGGFQCNFFFKAPFSGTVELAVGAETETPFLLTSEGKELKKQIVGAANNDYTETFMGKTWGMKCFQIKVVKGREYRLSTRYGNSRMVVNTPGIILFKNPGREDFDNYAYPIQYFYVPQNTEEVVFYDEYPEGTNGRGFLVTPDGKQLKRESTGSKNMFRVSVEKRYRGKLWSANFGHPLWRFKNIPNITSLQKFGYDE